MATDGISYLVAVTQLKASNANDEAVRQAAKPTRKPTDFASQLTAIATAWGSAPKLGIVGQNIYELKPNKNTKKS